MTRDPDPGPTVPASSFHLISAGTRHPASGAASASKNGGVTASGCSPAWCSALEVLRLLAAGSSNQRIARELFVALDTVKKHVTHVLGKLGAANRTQAVTRARQLGLIP